MYLKIEVKEWRKCRFRHGGLDFQNVSAGHAQESLARQQRLCTRLLGWPRAGHVLHSVTRSRALQDLTPDIYIELTVQTFLRCAFWLNIKLGIKSYWEIKTVDKDVKCINVDRWVAFCLENYISSDTLCFPMQNVCAVIKLQNLYYTFTQRKSYYG